MGLFSRRAPRTGGVVPPRDPDAALPNLGRTDADRLRRLVVRASARRGMGLVASGDHVRTRDGEVFGLWNLSSRLAATAPGEWEAAVQQHVDRLLKVPDLDSISDEVLERSAVLRLHEPLAHLAEAGVRPHWCDHPDLVLALSIDLAEAVFTPPQDYWDARGDYDDWTLEGVRNLSRLLDEADLDVQEVDGPGDQGFVHIRGSSHFVASFTTFLPLLASRVGHPDRGRGLLVATPGRHEVVLRAVTGAETPEWVMLMLRYAEMRAGLAAGPLSPTVFWAHRRDAWVPLNGEDRLRDTLVVTDDLLARALGLSADPW